MRSIRITWKTCENPDCLVPLSGIPVFWVWVGDRVCIFNKFPGDADSAGPAVLGYLSARADPTGRSGGRRPLKMLPRALTWSRRCARFSSACLAAGHSLSLLRTHAGVFFFKLSGCFQNCPRTSDQGTGGRSTYPDRWPKEAFLARAPETPHLGFGGSEAEKTLPR